MLGNPLHAGETIHECMYVYVYVYKHVGYKYRQGWIFCSQFSKRNAESRPTGSPFAWEQDKFADFVHTCHCYNYYSNGPDGRGHIVHRAKGAETGTTSKAPKLHVTCYVHIQHSRVADKETSCMSQDHCPGNGQSACPCMHHSYRHHIFRDYSTLGQVAVMQAQWKRSAWSGHDRTKPFCLPTCDYC